MKLAPLAPLYERPGPWASVYVDTSIADESTLSRRDLQAREVSDELARQGADEATCRVVREAVGSYPHGEGAAGHAVFATHGEVVFDPVLSVPPPGEPTITWSPLPHVAPLLELAPDEPDCLVAYIDRTGADLELRTPSTRRSEGQVHGLDWPVHRTASDWSERHFQLSVENTWEENARTVASAIEECLEQTGAELVILAGDEREMRTVHECLPDRLPAAVVETQRGGRAAGSATEMLDEDIERERRACVRQRIAEDLERFRAARSRSGGRTDAADGVPALIEAAREHRIDTLFLKPDGPDGHREVWAGSDPDQIAMRRTDARALGEPEPFRTRADDALLRSAAATGAEAVVVDLDFGYDRGPEQELRDDNRTNGGTGPGEPEPEPVGGLGALLRWPTEGEHPQPEPGTA